MVPAAKNLASSQAHCKRHEGIHKSGKLIKQLKNHVEGYVLQNTSLAQFHINDHKVIKGQLYTSVRIEPTGPVLKTGE